MKYRNLTYNELDVMQEDFLDFLYSEGFSRYDWRVLQDQHSEQAVHMIQRYSEQTFDKVMQSIEFLEYRSPKRIVSYHCESDSIISIGIHAPLNSTIDFTKIESLKYLTDEDLKAYKCYKEVIPYTEDRAYTVFKLIESGHFAVDEKNFYYLQELRQSNQN